MNKKILIFGNIPPPYHGVAIMTQNIIKAFQKNNMNNFFIENNYSKDIRNIQKKGLKKIIIFIKILLKSIILINKNNIDWIYYPISIWKWAFIRDGILLKILSFFVKKNIILHFHGIGIKNLYNENIILKFFVKLVLKNVKGYIVLGERLKEDLDMVIDKNRIKVVPNGIDLIKKNINYISKNDNIINILFCSNLLFSKGIDIAIKSIKILVQQLKCTNFKMIIIGNWINNNEERMMIEFINKNYISQYIEFVGEKIGDDKWNFFACSDIFVFPTKNDSFGLVNLEAMQFGLPIISTITGAIPEVIIDGENGFLINPNDTYQLAKKMLLLINDEELRNKIRINNIKRFDEKYTLEVFTKNFIDAIKEINLNYRSGE